MKQIPGYAFFLMENGQQSCFSMIKPKGRKVLFGGLIPAAGKYPDQIEKLKKIVHFKLLHGISISCIHNMYIINACARIDYIQRIFKHARATGKNLVYIFGFGFTTGSVQGSLELFNESELDIFEISARIRKQILRVTLQNNKIVYEQIKS